MERPLETLAVIVWCMYMQFADVLCEEKCLKNEIFGDREGNIYFCPNDLSEYTECCEKDREFTCCEKNIDKNGYEQVILWCTVAGVIILMILICVCIKKDVNCCIADRWIFYQYTPRGKAERCRKFNQMGKERQQPMDNAGYVFEGDLKKSDM